jgi:CheY-like chemotaxis protein
MVCLNPKEVEKKMEKPLEILVIEDKESHQNDIKTMLEARQRAGVNIRVTYVSTLDEAYAKMPYVDGVISDVFFPEQQGKEPENQAQKIFDKAVALKKPFIFCTDGDHHGPQLQETYSQLSFTKGKGIYLGMVDYAADTPDRLSKAHESRMKNWPKAYYSLMRKISPTEAEAFDKYVSGLGMDAKEILKGYWGPDHETLSRIMKGVSK